jgi:hypothetical protein
MTTVVLIPVERDELVEHANIVDPPRRGVLVGDATACAIFAQRIPDSYTRPTGTDAIEIPVGWSVSQTCARNPATGEVEVRAAPVYRLLDKPGASLSVATGEKLLSAVGERGPNRRFSLRFRFDRFGDGR